MTHNSHETQFRVYYQDTDAGGVMYHSNYLNFAERARTEFLRKLGILHNELKEKEGLMFVIKKISVEYKKPVRLDDLLAIQTKIAEVGKVRMDMEQDFYRGEELVAKVLVHIVCVNETLRPTKIPEYIFPSSF